MKTIDDDVSFPNVYGGKVRSKVVCTFDMRSGKVTDILITEADAKPNAVSPQAEARITAVMVRSGRSCKDTTQTQFFKDMLANIAAATDQDLLATANKNIDAEIEQMGLTSWCKSIREAIPFS